MWNYLLQNDEQLRDIRMLWQRSQALPEKAWI